MNSNLQLILAAIVLIGFYYLCEYLFSKEKKIAGDDQIDHEAFILLFDGTHTNIDRPDPIGQMMLLKEYTLNKEIHQKQQEARELKQWLTDNKAADKSIILQKISQLKAALQSIADFTKQLKS